MRTCENGTCNKPAEYRAKKTIYASNHNNAFCSHCIQEILEKEGTTFNDYVYFRLELSSQLWKLHKDNVEKL